MVDIPVRKPMARNKWTLTLVALLVGWMGASCLQDNHGFPGAVVIDRSNRPVVIKGDESPYNFFIQDPKSLNEYPSMPNEAEDSMIAQWEWLTIKSAKFSKELIFIAAPNTTGRDRKACVYTRFGPEYGEISVRQKPTE